MTLDTVIGVPMGRVLLNNYLHTLVNKFFKILPIKENEEDSLVTYMRSLQIEILGCKELIVALQNDAYIVALLSKLQYLIDNPNCDVSIVKREVFAAISICNKLKCRYEIQPIQPEVMS